MSENAIVQVFGNKVPFTKENQREAVNTLVKNIKDGEVDPITAYTTIKALYECLGLFLKDKDVVDSTVAACEKFGKEGASYNGASLVVTEASVRYDFSICGDSKWKELAAQKAEIDTKIKAREAFLKAVPAKQTIVNEETGEIDIIYPPAKTSSTTVKVTFAK